MKNLRRILMNNKSIIISALLAIILTTNTHSMDNKRPTSDGFEQQTQTKRMRAEEAPAQSNTMDQALLILARIKNKTQKNHVKPYEAPAAKQPSMQPIAKTAPKTIPLIKVKVAISTTAQKPTVQNQSTSSSSSSASRQTKVQIKHHTKLHKATQNNDANAIRELLKPVLSQQSVLKQIINTKTSKGLTPLMFAAHFGSIDAFDALLENGADVTIESDKNITAFDIVAEKLNQLGQYNTQENRFKTIKRDRYIHIYNRLLPYFADKLTERQAQQKLPSCRSKQAVNKFYEIVGNDRLGAFQRAIIAADIDEVERLIKEHPEYLNTPNNNGYTPLHVAIRTGSIYLTKLLLKNKADPLKQNTAGKNVIDIVDQLLATITEAPVAGTFEYNIMQINLLLEEARMVAQVTNQLMQASNAQSSSSIMPRQETATSAMNYQQQSVASCSLPKDCHTCILPRNAQ